MAEACVDFAARAIKELFPPDGPVRTNIIGEANDEKTDIAERKRDYMNWQLTSQIEEFRDEQEQMLTQLPLGGSQFLKLWYDESKKRPCAEFVPIDNILLPFSASNFYTAQRATEIQDITQWEFERRVTRGLYRDVVVTKASAEPDETAPEKANNKIEGKEFTKIELSIMRKVMDLALRDLEEAWAPVHKTDIQYVRTEVNPQFVGVVPPSDVIISTTFEVELENASGTIAIVIPYSTIEPIKNKLNSSFQTEADRGDKEWIAKLEEHIRQTHAHMRVNLGAAEITVGDLVNLSVGDIIPLTQDADGELELMVEGVPKYRCFFGVSRGNRAVQVTRIADDE
jgi:flagellar motor switch/type III secretory pathway protein FliN